MHKIYHVNNNKTADICFYHKILHNFHSILLSWLDIKKLPKGGVGVMLSVQKNKKITRTVPIPK